MHSFVLLNGRIGDAGAPLIAAGQFALLSGWGVFSTLRVAGGIPFAFERHWDRMERDAAKLRVPFPQDRESVYGSILKLIEANGAKEAALRIVVARNHGGVWNGVAESSANWIALTMELRDWGQGARLTVCPNARYSGGRFRGVKSTSCGENMATLDEARARGFDEALLLNERGEVCECTSANIFVVRDGRVWTPPLESGCLAGVTRDLLLGEIAVDRIPVAEKTLLIKDLEEADEMFISSTTRGVLPVLSINGRPSPGAGEITRALEAAFGRYVDAYVASHRRDVRPAPRS